MLDQFKPKQKDVIIILDCSIGMSEGQRFTKAVDLAILAFDEFIKHSDRVSFMIFKKNVYVKFSLVEKWKNTENLRNQITIFKKETPSFSRHRSLSKAIIESLNEFSFKVTKDNPHWIIIFTSGVDTKVYSRNEQLENLRFSRANMLIVNVVKDSADSKALINIAKYTKEGMYLEDPSVYEFELAMTSICSIDTPFQPVIIELFT
jgi:uncharacterized protein (DUF58 family)